MSHEKRIVGVFEVDGLLRTCSCRVGANRRGEFFEDGEFLGLPVAKGVW